MRLPMTNAITSLLLTAMLAGCAAEPSWFRAYGPRSDGTIFTALDLPAPNTIRTASGAPGHEYWQQRADYIIEAALDADTNTVSGSARITYTNNSPDQLDYIWLHLEQNIFRADSIGAAIAANSSIGMREAFGEGYTIGSVRANGTELELHVYDTLGRIDLDTPIQPRGGQFTFDITWSFVIPDRAFRRFGLERVEQGTIYEVAQWFPAVVVYDDVYGWNALPYLGTGEFYTNFGDYDVKLTVPREHFCVATGALQNATDVFTSEQVERLNRAHSSEEETIFVCAPDEVGSETSRPNGDGPLTWHFKAENVRTFAWASSDAFIYDAASLGDTLIQSVYPKEATPNWHDSTQMLRTAIKGYNEKWYVYPYPVATNVNGPEGGMEYPMIIFCGSRNSERGLYGVTTHEIGHNWFPMVVNTDERRHAWMDEGFNTFINYYSTADWFPGEKGRRGNADAFAPTMLKDEIAPMEAMADHLPRGLLGELEYAKPAVGLVLLREQILGAERFDKAFRTYMERWAFKSPRPADFFRCMEDAAGADLAWFWRGWFLESGWLDQGIGEVDNDFPRRHDPDESGQISLTIHNLGELVMPLDLTLTYADGTEEHLRLPVEIWFSTNRWTKEWSAPSPLVRVEIDADRVFPDVHRDNNVWSRTR